MRRGNLLVVSLCFNKEIIFLPYSNIFSFLKKRTYLLRGVKKKPLKYTFPLLCFLFFGLHAQELPPIQNYQPEEYHGENQNWDISQSLDKLIYVANNKGLLEFNGASWSLYPSPNETIMRSVKVVGDRIYTGSFMEFGYWTKNSVGGLDYTSIASTLSVGLLEDEEFWNIIALEDFMVFQSLKRIYIYNVGNKTISTISSKNTITKMFLVDGTVYFQRLGQGLFKIQSGKDILVSNAPLAKDDEIINVFGKEENLLLLTKNNGFFKINALGGLSAADNYPNKMLKDLSLYDGIQLKDGTYALGTISNGLISLDSNGKLEYQINQNNGLSNNTVLALFEDMASNIWLGLDHGISYVNVKSPYRNFNDYDGDLGSVYAAALHQGNLYLGTNQGLYYKVYGTNDRFKLITGTQGQVWSLQEFNGILLCGHHKGTFQIKDTSAEQISEVQGAWKFSRPDNTYNILLQGNYDGLYVLVFDGTTWKLKNKIVGFNNSSRYFETLGNTIFVNHEYNGVFELKVNPGYTKVEQVVKDTQIKGSKSGLIKYRGDLLYAYKKGIFKYNVDQNTFIRDTVLSKVYSSHTYESGKLITDTLDNTLWIFTKPGISFVTPTALSSDLQIKSIPLNKEMRDGILGYENIINLGDSRYLLGKTSGYTIFDLRQSIPLDFEVQLSSVANINFRKNEDFVPKDVLGEFSSNQNDFHFSFYVPEYQKYLETQYQYKLEGIYDDWSGWTNDVEVLYENLPYGDYEFRVQARLGNQKSSNVAAYSFTIDRPWFISNVMLATYIIGVIFFSLFMHNVYNKYYRRQREKLVEKNKRELEFAQMQSEKEIIKIKNQQLQQENKSKTKELAASTMSIIKKNELLGKIKKELVNSVGDESSIKPVVQIIDKNLNQSDDWEMFQEAFNNADSTFLKTVKSLHPKLSPNDLKLCAYLRLNLSSKEIAQLLNISPRSVEIKRYRLRKKLDLNHEDNLVNYILEV